MGRSMRRGRVALGVSLLMLGALMATTAHAGQVRVTVNNNFFSPYAVNINQGDHVVWVWLGSPHTVTSWDSANVVFDGIFDSQPSHLGQNNTTRFSWKSDRTGHVPYVCVPHISDPMAARVIIAPLTQPPTINVADFRLTEVQFNVASDLDLIEISNLGGAAGDLQSFRLATSATGTGVPISANSFSVPAGGRVVIHTNEAGTNGTPAGHIYTPALGALGDASGSLALYVPSTVTAQNALTNSALMLDFVQWGAGAQPNETTAGAAGFWTSGQSVNNVGPGHSIAYCANSTLDHGIDRWAEIDPPSLGLLNDCNTPVLSQTWGKLKVIYRP